MDPWAKERAQANAILDTLPQRMRPVAVLSPDEARQKADKIRPELFASWNRLRRIVLAHEEAIQRRWKKRTGAKRKQLLQEIDSKLPKEHAPEISALSQGSTLDKLNDFRLPYLNLEDLTINNGTQFLGLLHARAHYPPSQFAWFDSDTLHFGIVAGAIPRQHGMSCGMIVFGDQDTYGKVLPYSEPLEKSDATSPDGFEMEHNLRESMSFGDGLAVLETQAKLMEFLIGVVTKILHDLDLTNLTPVAPLPAPSIPILETSFQWQSSARFNALRPYGPPPAFSIDEIGNLLDTQYELAVQHLGDLRTDPMYLAETIQSYYDHRPETILGKAPLSLIQSRAVSLMLSDAYSFLAFYHVAQAIIAEFRVVETNFPNGMQRARELPKAYVDALKPLYPILGLLDKHLTKVHHTTMGSSAALRKGLTLRCNDPAFAKHDMIFESLPGDELYWYMTILLQEQQTHLWQVARIFDQLDRITQDPVAHQRISPLIASLFSQWGVVNDCKSILEWHRPAIEDDEDLQEGVQQRLQKWHPLLASVVSTNFATLAHKAFPLSGFTYPKGPRNPAWATKCQAVDEAFAAFWTAADILLVKTCGKELFALGEQETASFAVAPTDWVALAAPKAVVRPKPTPAALLPFGGAEQSSAEKSQDAPVVNPKPKTRGVAMVSEDTRPEQDTTESSWLPTAVSSKTYKVFSVLFTATVEIAQQQRSVAWKDILMAFDELGFDLIRTRGSAWTFRHADGSKSVTVHEPHPEPTMGFWAARRFGRRLTRRFGWTLSSFALGPPSA
ncbi:hypothetical protein GGX14DRAFT_505295 [Mycena pura]|uniref:Uncharacterized protein n=1 Tax=Mycena pura TaxID=153505 RepID=A0AAD6UUP0_9AGAR|nr:hypothetical protein GGX14DRAFT_505295 [Mycena pura]